MRWTAPLDRREIGFILLCLGTYFVAYNIEITLQVLGIDAAATKGAVLSRLGVGSTVIGDDGRKPAGWRDSLELDIFGTWQWFRGHVAGDGTERSQLTGSGRHGAQWVALKDIEDVGGLQKPFGDSTVNDVLQNWGDDIPQTRLVNHASGYTTLDNVYLLNGSVYLVTDSGNTLPAMSTILSSTGAGFKEWQAISPQEGRTIFGKSGSTIRGVSWMHADSTPDNFTLFALWRTYSSLDTSITSSGTTSLPLPRRLIFPHNTFFTDPDPNVEAPYRKRQRFDTGFHPYTAKAAFPFLSVMYKQDWEDYHAMTVPFIFERLVIADRSAAVKAGQPAYASALSLESSTHWWEPVRKNMAQYLGEYEVKKRSKKDITYIHNQGTSGAKLSDEDHNILVKSLQNLAWKEGHEINIISTELTHTNWTTRMTGIVKSSIVLGVHGNHLLDGLFMRPSPQSTLLELFPANTFVRDRELAVRSVGLQYRALRDTRYVRHLGIVNAVVDALS
ncbi:hypothetical protein HYPSUDRAFT_152040 [Hypholoma sublateritium FD-334 SS-4]|uniref:Uncharacterized protein n=1 Tax=Hypholoma sublateritium (strain FD-334 SS-4) TaxID=945553 RepID=A0A0D2N8G7_HYPSF|nr:hypothetical protein HYPSUDRAFT_152040 [Hypholoma sublateritium FD-334 SS-4]